MRIALSILLASGLSGAALGEVVYLRNSIGATSATTDGNGWYETTYDISDGRLALAPVQVRAMDAEEVRLTRVRVVLGALAPLGLSAFSYTVRVWDSWAALIANPRDGNVRNIPFSVPTSLMNFGGDTSGFPTYEAIFEISSSEIVLPAMGECWLAIEAVSPGTFQYGMIGIMESTEAQPDPPNDEPDRQVCHSCTGGWHYTTDPACYWRLHDGRLAYEVIGETLGAPCPGDRGDANCDGALDFFDIDPFLTALFDPATYAAGFCGGSVCAADADCSEVVDFFDIDPFLNCLFSGCAPCP